MSTNRKAFRVLYETPTVVSYNHLAQTSHFSNERTERHNRITETLGEPSKCYSFVVDTEHPNGYEVHNVFNNGVIMVCNQRTGLLVTELIARPQQIRRYWEGLNKALPIEVMPIINKARYNQERGYNNW